MARFAAAVAKQQVTVFTVGVGASDGAPIPIKDKEGQTIDWKKTKEGTLVKSRLDENTLIRIAAATGGQYLPPHRRRRASIPSWTFSPPYERKRLAEKIKTQKIERFHYPLARPSCCCSFEMVLSERKLHMEKKIIRSAARSLSDFSGTGSNRPPGKTSRESTPTTEEKFAEALKIFLSAKGIQSGSAGPEEQYRRRLCTN